MTTTETIEIAPETCLALAKIARFARRSYVGPTVAPSRAMQTHDNRDLAALVPEVAEAVRAVEAVQPSGRGWDSTHPSTSDRMATRAARVHRLGELLDAHYPGLCR